MVRKKMPDRRIRKGSRTLRKNPSRFLGYGKIALIGIALIAVCAAVFQISGEMNKKSVYAAAGESVAVLEDGLPTGLAGVISGVNASETMEESLKRIGTSFEEVMVGQRTFQASESAERYDMSGAMEAVVDTMDLQAAENVQSADMMSDTDYDTLLRIVEAEAGGEDLKGKILVANVIMNRVRSPEFPDTVTEVVWETTEGTAQFSPTYDGRINTVTVSDETMEAVRQALEGVDYSQGALFFVAKEQADQRNVAWFDSDLEHLFEYGVHDFYTYPDERAELDN